MISSYSIRVDMQATGSKIKELRKQKQIKVVELAEILHSSENTIFKWQRGECLPTIDNLIVLSTVFETPMDDIIQVEGRGDEPLLPVIEDLIFITTIEELDCITQGTVVFDRTNVTAVKVLLSKHSNLISWMRKLPSFYETEQVIFVHAGIDETAGMNWIAGTSEETFLWKYPPATGMFYKSIISGHVGTNNEALSNDQEFHGVFYDGMSHYYIDGSVYTKTGRLNMVAVDEADGTVYLTDDDKCQKVPAYWNC